ncbi:MAG: GNAT family N-acetyltransferase [Pyrinomonadaceae bacterium]
MKARIFKAMPDAGVINRWERFLADADLVTHYTSPGYFTDPFVDGERFAIFAEDENEEYCGLMTGVCRQGIVTSGLFSRPQTAFRTGQDKAEIARTLADGLEEVCERPELVEIYSWGSVDSWSAEGFSERQSGESNSVAVLNLSDGADAVFSGFSQSRRSDIRKAIKAGILEPIKELETEQELAELYEIHRGWKERKGQEPDTLEQMRFAMNDREYRRTFITKVDGRVVAGSLYRFCTGGVVEYAANFSLPEFQKLRPNDLLGWHAIQWACGAGLKKFSLGGSNLFLRRFGGEVVNTYRYRRDNSPLRMHDLREKGREIGVGAYGLLPDRMKAGVKRMFAR